MTFDPPRLPEDFVRRRRAIRIGVGGLVALPFVLGVDFLVGLRYNCFIGTCAGAPVMPAAIRIGLWSSVAACAGAMLYAWLVCLHVWWRAFSAAKTSK